MTLAWYSWLIGFGLTLLFELPVAGLCLKSSERRLGRRLMLVVFANVATHPLVWFFFPKLPIAAITRLALSELWAFGAEALFYWLVIERAGAKRAIGTSLLANGVSYVLGAAIVARCAHWFYQAAPI